MCAAVFLRLCCLFLSLFRSAFFTITTSHANNKPPTKSTTQDAAYHAMDASFSAMADIRFHILENEQEELRLKEWLQRVEETRELLRAQEAVASVKSEQANQAFRMHVHAMEHDGLA